MRVVLCFLLMLPALVGRAQHTEVDSLRAVLNTQTADDTTRVRTLARLSRALMRSKPDSALNLARESLQLAEQLDDRRGQATALTKIGISHAIKGDYAQALDYFQQSLAIKRQIGDKQGIAGSLGNIGLVYKEKGDYAQALDHYRQSLAIKRQIGDKLGIATSLNNIGVVYKKTGEYAQALDYYQQSLAVERQIGNEQGIATSLNNIGNIYISKGDYAQALDYFRQSLDSRKQIGDKKGIASSLNNIGVIYEITNNYTQALDYYRQSLDIRKQIGAKADLLTSYAIVARVYDSLKRYDSAYYYRTLQAQYKDTVFGVEKTKALEELAAKYRSDRQRDSIANLEAQRKIEQAKFKAESERLYVIIGGAGLALILTGGGLLLLRNRNREVARQRDRANMANEELNQQKEELQTTLDTLRATQTQLVQSEKMASLGQLTAGIAHEINNPINYVTGGAQSLEYIAGDLKNYTEQIPDLQESVDDLSDISGSIIVGANKVTEIVGYLRSYSRLDEAEQKEADLNDGLRATAAILKGQFGDDAEITTDLGELPQILCYPAELNQAFTNILLNAEEAIAARRKAEPDLKGDIRISSEVVDNQIEIRVSDNGVGVPEGIQGKIFDPFFSTKDVDSKGLGLSTALGSVQKHNGSLKVESTAGNGTTITIKLPTDN